MESCGGPYMNYTNASEWVMVFFLHQSVIFENLMKKLIVAGVLRINMWFSVHVPKIKFEPSPQGKNALVLIF